MKKIHLLTLLSIFLFANLSFARNKQDYINWAHTIAKSEMTRNAHLWQADFQKKPKWDYTQGLVAQAILATYQVTSDTSLLRYVDEFADFFVNEDGTIKTYVLDSYSLDRVNGGKFLFDYYELTKKDKYLKAVKLLRSQLDTHPRMSNGVFWHKKVYPEQVWLDGLYMADPFYARCINKLKEDKKLYDDVALQFILTDSLTLDTVTGLNYHAYNDDRKQPWADKTKGHSPNFWGRAIGWYMMAMVDVLDYMPKRHPARKQIIKNFNRLTDALLAVRDPATKMWYQVPNIPDSTGNYTESSCTAMFIYAIAKGARMKYYNNNEWYAHQARTSFEGLISNATIKNPDGTITISKACGVAGLGGTPYRSGTFDYYITEPIRNDDPKVVGPFILAALELAK